ncbi:hypothetical protein BDR22DRAFT_887212 [Usnea florida]
MTPKAHSSPKPLILYPYLHRNSQCCSCHTVIPGDICFNCGRLSTLLVTPRPPRDSLKTAIKVQQPEPVVLPPKNSPVLEFKAFDSQYALVETLLAKRREEEERVSKAHLERAFDTQLEEIEDLLDAGRKFAKLCNVAADDVVTVTGKRPATSTSFRRPLTPAPPGHSNKSSTTYSTKLSSKSSKTLRPNPFAENGRSYRENTARCMDAVSPTTTSSAPSPPAHHHESFNTHSTSLSGSSKSSHTIQPDTFAAEDGFSEDGRPYRENMSRWMEDVRPAVDSSATLSRRGVECRLRMPGKVCEWVIFL